MVLFYAPLLFAASVIAMPGLIPWPGPMPTPMGLMAAAGMSPRPTGAPRLNLNGLPQELRRRQTNVQYPPPENWGGFVNSLYGKRNPFATSAAQHGFFNTSQIARAAPCLCSHHSFGALDPLSCSVGLTCVNSGAALGCCSATTGICTALYTTCSNYFDTCDTGCQVDPSIRKCDVAKPFCGTYAFDGGTHLYNCQTTAILAANVEFLNEPEGGPSATELDGASARHTANLTTPWVEGPYEMPNERQ